MQIAHRSPCRSECKHRWPLGWPCPSLSPAKKYQARREPEGEISMAAIKILATTLCLVASTAAFAEDPLPRAKPEEVGLSSERLARIGAVLKADVDAGR